MDELIAKLLDVVGALGIPGAIVFSILYFLETRKVESLRDKVDAINELRIIAASANGETIVALTREAVGAMKDTASAVNRVADSGDQIREGLTKVADAVNQRTVRAR